VSTRTARLSIERRDGRCFIVSSAKPDGSTATYRVDPGELACDCAAGRRDRACRHLRLVLELLHSDATPTGR
jgi:hypothetical protein